MNYEANSPNPALTGIHQHPPGTHLEKGKERAKTVAQTRTLQILKNLPPPSWLNDTKKEKDVRKQVYILLASPVRRVGGFRKALFRSIKKKNKTRTAWLHELSIPAERRREQLLQQKSVFA